MNEWGSLMDCGDVFEGCVQRFECVCSSWPLFIDYVQKTWLIHHKEKFVKTWTYRMILMGNMTSNIYVCILCIFLIYASVEL